MEKMEGKEARELLKEGKVLENLHITELRMAKFTFEHPIQITDCEIDTLDMNRSVFNEKVLIRRCKIKQLVLSDSTFLKGLDCRKNTITQGKCQRLQSHETTHFSESTWGSVSFFQSEFHQDAIFHRSTFRSEMNGSEMICHQNTNFQHCHFKDRVRFNKSDFKGDFDFSHAIAEQNCDASEAIFRAGCLFNHTQITLNAFFKGTEFHGFTDFLRSVVGQSVHLEPQKLGEKQSFRFLNSSIHYLIVDHESVVGHLFEEKRGNYTLASVEYGQLRIQYQRQSKFDSEDLVYYHFKRCERLAQPSTGNPLKLLLRFLDFAFLDKGCGYGTQPFRTLGVCFAIILSYAVTYFWALPYTKEATYGLKSLFLNKVFFAFDMSLRVFSGGYGEVKTFGFYKFFVMSEYLLGVIFMGLFVVSFSRKIIR